uniref:Putative lipase n=1 Tax=Streptomyces sp. SANK 60405 TaxID=689687 RepID=D4QF33_9ACTN|nr:putative lipase [Streptomyces sp. SANK 60405]
MKSLTCGEEFRFNGVVSLQQGENWLAPWRVPFDEARLYFPEGGIGRAAMPSGVSIALVTDAAHIEMDYLCSRCPDNIIELAEDVQQLESVDVVVNGRRLGRHALSALKTQKTLRLDLGDAGGGSRLVEIWLPLYAQFRLIDLRVEESANASSPVPNPRRWVHYGGSLSQGMGADSPLTNYVQSSRWRTDLDLVSVARGKGTHMEPLFADLIAGLRPRYVTMAVGGMIYLTGSLNQYTYLTNLLGFVKRIIDAVPDCEVVVIVPPMSPRYRDLKGPGGMTAAEMVEMHYAAVETVMKWGDKRVHQVRQWADADEPDFLADGIHLTSSAHRRYGQYLAREIRECVG